MFANEENTVYKAFGLEIVSDFVLPELPTVKKVDQMPKVFVIKADLTLLWSELMDPGINFVVKESLIMFHVPEVGIYSVKNGNEIIVSPIKGSEADQVRLYILGTCMGAILLQRRILPLHGSAIAIDGKAYAFVGYSGAGKSTLASAFLNRGYHLISDDVIPVTLSEKDIPAVIPAYPQQKLWLESLNQFGMQSDGLRPIIGRETKFAVPIKNKFVNQIMPLGGVFELIRTNNNDIEISPIHSLIKIQTLFNHTYRNFFVDASGLLDWHFRTTVTISSSIEMYQLRRPKNGFTAHDLVDIVLMKINKKEMAR